MVDYDMLGMLAHIYNLNYSGGKIRRTKTRAEE
jgi:hypothetical protein